jgi:HTH-type transcriptional regulator/antitoxin HigA
MATKLNKVRESDTYLDMIRRFPLRPIRNDDDHAKAVKIIGKLLSDDEHDNLDSGAGDYLDTLILLVNKYEDENHTPLGTDLSPQEALKVIMSANGLTQADIGRIIGSESGVSMFLKGERELSKAQIRRLAERFRVSTDWFL